MGSTYRIVRGEFGWHAVPIDGGEARMFETHEAALAWCDQRSATLVREEPATRADLPTLTRR